MAEPVGDQLAGALEQGLVIAVFIYWGWDAAFSVTEETRSAETSARSGYLTLVTTMLLFVTGAIAFNGCSPRSSWPGHPADTLIFFASTLAAEPWPRCRCSRCCSPRWPRCWPGLIPTARQALAMGREPDPGQGVDPGAPVRHAGRRHRVQRAIALVIAVLGGEHPAGQRHGPGGGQRGRHTGGRLLRADRAGLRGALPGGAARGRPLEALTVVVIPAACGLAMFALGGVLVASYLTKSDPPGDRPEQRLLPAALPGGGAGHRVGGRRGGKVGRRSDYFRTGRGTDETTLELRPVEVDGAV